MKVEGQSLSAFFGLSVCGDTVRVSANPVELRHFQKQMNKAIRHAIKNGRGCVMTYAKGVDTPFKIAVNCDSYERRIGIFQRLRQWRVARVLGLW